MNIHDSGLAASGIGARRTGVAIARPFAALGQVLAALAFGLGLASPGLAAAQPARQAIPGTDVAMTVFDPGMSATIRTIAWLDNARVAFIAAPPNPEGKPLPKPLGLAIWRIGAAPVLYRPELTSTIERAVARTLYQSFQFCITPDRIAYVAREPGPGPGSTRDRLMIGPHHGEQVADLARLSFDNLSGHDAVNPFTCRIVRIPDIPTPGVQILPLRQPNQFLILPPHRVNGPIQLHDAATGATKTLLQPILSKASAALATNHYEFNYYEFLAAFSYVVGENARHPERRQFRWQQGWTIGLNGGVAVLDIPDDDDTSVVRVTKVGDYIGREDLDRPGSSRPGGYLRRGGLEIKIIDGPFTGARVSPDGCQIAVAGTFGRGGARHSGMPIRVIRFSSHVTNGTVATATCP